MTETDHETDGSYTCATCGDAVGNIVDLVAHGCETILSAPSLSASERSTLMYVESRLVDHGGSLAPEQMNHEDYQNLKLFRAAGLLRTDGVSQVESFTDGAWDLARDCRQVRAASHLDGGINIGTVPGGE